MCLAGLSSSLLALDLGSFPVIEVSATPAFHCVHGLSTKIVLYSHLEVVCINAEHAIYAKSTVC